jgi:hypothetical protein
MEPIVQTDQVKEKECLNAYLLDHILAEQWTGKFHLTIPSMINWS